MRSDSAIPRVEVPTRAGAAHRAFSRLLRTAFGDDARARVVVDEALAAARLRAVPDDVDALLDFVRAHLGPRMRAKVGERLVIALVEDIEAELEHERSHGDPSSSRIAVATRMPPRAETQPAPPVPALTAPPPSPSLAELAASLAVVGPLEEAPSTKLRRGTPVVRAPRHVARPSVLLVDPDRFGRSSLARALVSGSCDVTVIDDATAATTALAGEAPHVVVTEIAGLEIEALLQALVARHPDVPVLAWTRVPRANVELLLRSAAVASFEVLPKTSRTADVLATVRRLASG